jgi:hypothetical protein
MENVDWNEITCTCGDTKDIHNGPNGECMYGSGYSVDAVCDCPSFVSEKDDEQAKESAAEHGWPYVRGQKYP